MCEWSIKCEQSQADAISEDESSLADTDSIASSIPTYSVRKKIEFVVWNCGR